MRKSCYAELLALLLAAPPTNIRSVSQVSPVPLAPQVSSSKKAPTPNPRCSKHPNQYYSLVETSRADPAAVGSMPPIHHHLAPHSLTRHQMLPLFHPLLIGCGGRRSCWFGECDSNRLNRGTFRFIVVRDSVS